MSGCGQRPHCVRQLRALTFQACHYHSAVTSKITCVPWVAATSVHTVVANLKALNPSKRAFITLQWLLRALALHGWLRTRQPDVRQ
eukprot:7898317-Karenia_brevis.AAC.1